MVISKELQEKITIYEQAYFGLDEPVPFVNGLKIYPVMTKDYYNFYSNLPCLTMDKTVKKVTEDIENLKMNTAIAALMSLLNEIYEVKSINKAEMKTFITLLNPFAPHITEEMWEICGFDGMLNQTKWPVFDEAKCVDSNVEIAVQVNGKIKARIQVPAEVSSEDAISQAKCVAAVSKEIASKTIVKELYVKKRLVNIVVK